MIFVGDRGLGLVVGHEAAHQWFYGLVGDDQARHPWLDEAFATYAEALASATAVRLDRSVLTLDTPVDTQVTAFSDAAEYFTVVYAKGAVALLTAR